MWLLAVFATQINTSAILPFKAKIILSTLMSPQSQQGYFLWDQPRTWSHPHSSCPCGQGSVSTVPLRAAQSEISCKQIPERSKNRSQGTGAVHRNLRTLAPHKSATKVISFLCMWSFAKLLAEILWYKEITHFVGLNQVFFISFLLFMDVRLGWLVPNLIITLFFFRFFSVSSNGSTEQQHVEDSRMDKSL